MALTEGQRRCVETLDQPLVVAAGAGSGKTFTLTQRIAGAFEDKDGTGPFVTDIDQVCAITFTKKAAGELKSRIKAELRARNMVDQALRVDEAWISTIHGMCARILRAHAIQLGIDPAFTVAEEKQLSAFLDQAVESVLAEAEYEGSARLDALFREYKVRSFGFNDESVESMLKQLVSELSTSPNGADDLVLPGATALPVVLVSQALEIVETIFECAQVQKQSKSRDSWIQVTADQLAQAHSLLDQGITSYSDALRAISPFKLTKNFGDPEYKAQVDEGRAMLGSCIMEARLGLAAYHLETLLALARRVLDEFTALKRAAGALDNNDLLVLAARAIEEHPDIAAQYANKFKLVMVDEFQDTDQMQVDMIKRLAGEGAQRLCTVGDAQQSIYRFRGADVSVYRRHLAWMSADWPNSVIKLSANFRSHPDVLAFVDRIFEKPDMFGGEFMSLSAGREEARVARPFVAEQPRIVVQHTSYDRASGGKDVATHVAARRIASQFAALHAAGHAPGEMVVLLRGMKNANVYAQALRNKGLPCVIAGGSVFATTPEAQMMDQLARVIANPLETQALFNVLTSPLFALTAGDLLNVGGVDGFWRTAYKAVGEDGAEASSDIPQSTTLNCAFRVMIAMRQSVGRCSVAHVMQRVLVDSGWLSRRQAEGAEGLASAANALKAIRMVDGIERSGAVGPASLAVQFAETLANSKEAPGALSVSGGDLVRIMTIHASKGLEFPIVAVGELSSSVSSGATLITSSVAGKSFVSLDLKQTKTDLGDIDKDTRAQVSAYVLGDVADEEELAAAVLKESGALHRRLALTEHEAVGDAEELKRLLYVALTRAKEALVVSSVGSRTKDNPAGIPKSVLSGVFTALDPTGVGFESGQTVCEFGGSAPALVDVVALGIDQVVTEEQPTVSASGDESFMVPADETVPELVHEVYKAAHQGIFSYSSIADESHKGNLLEQLASSFAESVDEAAGAEDAFEVSSSAPLFSDANVASFDDDFWDFDLGASFDEDRATDLGTAFHRLAQYAVCARGGEGPLVMPPAVRIEALARTCNLDAAQRARLSAALERWFGCDVAHDMAEYADLSAEVPFFVAVPDSSDIGQGYLEGEIDLLALDAARTHATVVDYKTGGRDDETLEELRCKHVLQASCYAYAIMLQGVQEVDAIFVRVERACAHDAAQPQCVRYHFTASDLPTLQHAIALCALA